MKFSISLRSLFINKEKQFTEKFYERLNDKKYANLAGINSKLPLSRRIDIVRKLIAENSISGIFLSSNNYFFLLDKNLKDELEQNFKSSGKIEYNILKKQWAINEKLLKVILGKFGKGYLGETFYYSIEFLHSLLKRNLENCEEDFSLVDFSKELGLDPAIIIEVAQKLIENNEVKGVVNNHSTFLTEEKSLQLIKDLIVERSQELMEFTFEDIATELDIPVPYIEDLLLKIVREEPDLFVLYPLEKKIMFKK